MSKPVVPVDSLTTILASDKSTREAAVKQAAIKQRESECRQAAYGEFTAAFDLLHDFGMKLVSRSKREVVIETTRTDWLLWAKLWRRAVEHLTDEMQTRLRNVQLDTLPQHPRTAVQVLISQSTVSDEELANELRVLIEDRETRDLVEWLPWLRDELHPPIEIFSERHGYHKPKHAGMAFWTSPSEYVDPKYAAFFGHGGTTDNDNVSTRASSDFVKPQVAGQTKEKPVVEAETTRSQWLARLRVFLPKLKGIQQRVLAMLIDAGGTVTIVDIATDKAVEWQSPYKAAVDSLKRELNAKLRSLKTSIRQHNNCLELLPKAARKPKKAA